LKKLWWEALLKLSSNLVLIYFLSPLLKPARQIGWSEKENSVLSLRAEIMPACVIGSFIYNLHIVISRENVSTLRENGPDIVKNSDC
jgi:hypothetical protein